MFLKIKHFVGTRRCLTYSERFTSSSCDYLLLRLLVKLHDKGPRGGEWSLRLRRDRNEERRPSRSCLHKVSLSCAMRSA